MFKRFFLVVVLVCVGAVRGAEAPVLEELTKEQLQEQAQLLNRLSKLPPELRHEIRKFKQGATQDVVKLFPNIVQKVCCERTYSIDHFIDDGNDFKIVDGLLVVFSRYTPLIEVVDLLTGTLVKYQDFSVQIPDRSNIYLPTPAGAGEFAVDEDNPEPAFVQEEKTEHDMVNQVARIPDFSNPDFFDVSSDGTQLALVQKGNREDFLFPQTIGEAGNFHNVSLYSPTLGRMTIYSMQTGKELQTWELESPQVVRWNHGGKKLLAYITIDYRKGHYELTLNIRDMVGGETFVKNINNYKQFNGISWNPAGTALILIRRDLSDKSDFIKVLNVDDLKRVHTFDSGYQFIRSLSWSADGSKIAIYGEIKKEVVNVITILNSVDGAAVHTLRGHDGGVLSVAWCHTGRELIASSDKDCIKIWNPASGICLATIGQSNVDLYWAKDGKHLVSISVASGFLDQKTVSVWNADAILELADLSEDARQALELIDRELGGNPSGYISIAAQQAHLLDDYPELKKLLKPFIRVDYSSAIKRAKGHKGFSEAVALLGARETSNQETLQKYSPEEQLKILQRGLQLQNDILHSDELRRRFENAIRAVEAALAPGGAAGAE